MSATRLTRRDLLRAGAASAATLPILGACARRTEARRPNVLVVLASQYRGSELGFLGESAVLTPNLDRLAKQGVHVANAFTNSPSAGPSRATLWTGLYPLQHGVLGNFLSLDPSIATLGRLLTSKGWRSSYIGTWHLNGYPEIEFVEPGPARHGFDEFWAQWLRPHAYYDTFYRTDAAYKPILSRGYAPIEQTNLAVDRLQHHATSRTRDPFFMTVSFGTPHPPLGNVPAEFLARYEELDVRPRPNFVASDVEPGGDEASVREQLVRYFAACSAVDTCVGRLLATLHETALARDTIVVFVADHGGQFGEHGLFHKQQPFEESIRVPLIVRWPNGLRAGHSTEALFSLADLTPTVLSLCDVPIPSSMAGRDLSFALHGRVGDAPQSVYLTDVLGIGAQNHYGTFSWRGVRRADLLYAEDLGGPWLLYDLERDPYQLENLVDRPERKNDQQRCSKDLRRWLGELGERYRTPLEHLRDVGRDREMRSILNQQIGGAPRSPATRVLRSYLTEGTTWTNPRYR